MALLERRVLAVRRRLILSGLLVHLVWCWLTALVLAALCLLLLPLIVLQPSMELRWSVVGGLLGLGTVAALIVAYRCAPSAVAAALALDERFGLKERVTTSLMLSAAEAKSPAGQALLADVEKQLADLPLRARFPLTVPRLPATLLGLTTPLVVLVLVLWNPTFALSPTPEEKIALPESRQEMDEKMASLVLTNKANKPSDQLSAEEVQAIEREIDRFARQPRESREELRERIKDATELEEKIQRQQQQQAQQLAALREQLKQADRIPSREEKKISKPEGRAAQALARGDLDRTREELEQMGRQMEKEEQKQQLQRKLQDPKTPEPERRRAQEELKKLQGEPGLTNEQRELLARQLGDMEKQLQRLSRSKEDLQMDLEELAKQGDIDQETLDRELEQLKKNSAALEQDKKQIDDLIQELRKCKECTGQGKEGRCASKLAAAGQKFGQLARSTNQERLAKQLAQLKEAKQALCRCLGNTPNSQRAGIGAGSRPEAKDVVDHKDTLIRPEWNQGKMQDIGQGLLGGFQGPRKPAEIEPAIRQAAQEAPAALDRQRLPPAARNMARGYFEQLRSSAPQNKQP